VLIIESLDRLSRQDPWKAFGLFTEIINAGVDVVTLMDGRTYTVGAGLGDLIFSIVDMSRAHEESRAKSHRLRAAWVNKRNNANERKLTAKCPGWLRLSLDKKKFDILPNRAELVTRIFEETAAGIGLYSIARRLNEAETAPFGRSKGWHTSSISKILTGRAVLGEFQPHRLVNGRQIAEGEPIKDYFPAIIPEELYYRAQAARNQLRLNGAGRRGSNVSNLFSGLVKCAYCRARMRFENKGTGSRGGTFLACDSARRGLGCEKTRWRYSDFEASFLAFVKELDLESLVRSESDSERRADLQNEIAALRGELASIDEKRERTFELFSKAALASDFVGKERDAARLCADSEIKRVFRIIETTQTAARNRVAFALSIYAGLRVGEIAALTIGDVVTTAGEVRREVKLSRHQTKGSNGRTVVLSSRVQAELREYLKQRWITSTGAPLIASRRSGRAFSTITLSMLFKEIYETAGIKTSSHSGRRTFATRLNAKGVGMRTIQKLMGHKHISTTALYCDVSDEMLRNAVELV
jgi:integrase